MYKEKHNTNTFSERVVHDKFIVEDFILFPSAKSNKQRRKAFLRKFGVSRGKILRPGPIF